MREQDKALDEFFRRKLADREIGYEESHWEAAHDLIVADEQKRRRRAFLLVFLCLAMVVGLGWGTWKYATVSESQPQPLARIQHLDESAERAINGSDDNAISSQQPLPSLTPAPIQKEAEKGKSTASGVRKQRAQNVKTSDVEVTTLRSSAVEKNRKLEPSLAVSAQQVEETESTPAATFEALDIDRNRAMAQTLTRLTPAQSLIPTGDIHLSASPTVPQNPSLRKPYSSRQLSLIVGSNISRGLENGQATRAMFSSHPVLGVGYRHGLNPKFSLHARLLYEGRGGLNADTSLTSIRYSFGFEEEQILVSPKRLHYLSAPLFLQYHPTGRHSLTLGINPAWMFNSSGVIQRATKNTFGQGEVLSEVSWGYKQGFQSFDLGIATGYSYYLGKGITLGGEVHWGLRDLTRNDYFRNSARDQNLQFRLLLSYDLIRF